MLISLWNYLRGYVILEITGFSVERFVNLAVHKGVYIWDVQYTSNGVRMKVSIKAFKLLKSCARKTKCHIKIKGKMGYPFVVHRYRKRKILAFGLLFFILSLYSLSMFIWLIDVEGNDRIAKEEIINYCNQEGLVTGAFKFKLNEKELEEKLLKKFGDISWINIHTKGTRTTITLTETIPKQSIIDRNTPCNIVAKKEGLVVSIVTSAGTPKIKQQDVVQKGDLLVSGELLIVKDDETQTIKEYVHADAEVLAKMYYEINFKIPFSYTEKKYTGNIKKNYGLILFDKKINFFNNKIFFENYDKIISRKQMKIGENYPLPIIMLFEESKEFTPLEQVRTAEQAKELADRMVTGRIVREFDFAADVMDKQIEFSEEADYLAVKALVTTYERIDEEVPIATETLEQPAEGNETISRQ